MVECFNKLVVCVTSICCFVLMGCAGTLTDREGNSYRTVKIGSQTWMAENLNEKAEGSWCYEDKELNCQKHGRLYNWEAAKSVCPAGWHLPSKEEIETMLKVMGATKDSNHESIWIDAGGKLKSATGWKDNDGKSGNGTDDYSFSALPTGYKNFDGSFNYEGYGAVFWSSTSNGDHYAYLMMLRNDHNRLILDYYDKGSGSSVRCLKD